MIKTEENCKRCLWGTDNHCADFETCLICPRYAIKHSVPYLCPCNQIRPGDECPDYEPWEPEGEE